MEDIDYSTYQKEKEEEADKFASDTLLDSKQEQELISHSHFSKDSILYFSQKFNTAPSIIVGRLQHMSLLSFKALNDMKPNIELNFT